MNHPIFTATILRVYSSLPVTGACGCCGVVSRLSVVDLDRECPLCQDCVPASVQASEALRAVGLVPPDGALVERNP